MTSKFKELFVVFLLSLIPTIMLWSPFFLRLENFWGIPIPKEGMATIVANYDGPLFLVVAKTLYNPDLVGNFTFGLPDSYYAAHFPLFPILIRIFSPVFGYVYSMLFITLMSSFLALVFFYYFIRDFVKNKEQALWLCFVFSLLPARWLIVRSVGSSEPLFIAAIIGSLYYFRKEKYFLAGFWGAVAQMTKSPGALLFLSYVLMLSLPKLKSLATKNFAKWKFSFDFKKFLPLLLLPLSLFGVFYLYKIQMNDFFAYFNSGDNIHLFFPPFQIFNYAQPWVGTFWLEEVIFVYLFVLLGLIKLIQMKEYALSWFVGVFFFSLIFVSHRDVIRYALPIVPFLLAAFAQTIVKKEFKLVMLVLVMPVFLFSIAYISQNVMPIPDWAPLL